MRTVFVITSYHSRTGEDAGILGVFELYSMALEFIKLFNISDDNITACIEEVELR